MFQRNVDLKNPRQLIDKGEKTSLKISDLKLVVLARPGAYGSLLSPGHISLAIFRQGIWVDIWGFYLVMKFPFTRGNVIREPRIELPLFTKAAAMNITYSQYRLLEAYIRQDMKRSHPFFLGINDCTDWLLRKLKILGIPTPKDRFFPLNLIEDFIEHPEWELFLMKRSIKG